MVVTFGDSVIQPLPENWARHFRDVTIRWASPEKFNEVKYMAQAESRWFDIPSECDFVIFADADTLLLRPIDDLLEKLANSPSVAGTIAHYTFPQFPNDNPQERWNALAKQFIGKELPFEFTHTFSTEQTEAPQRYCPFYLNFGFVIFPRGMVEVVRTTFISLRPQIASCIKASYFSGQVALTLAIYAHELPRHAVSLKFNFPNDEFAEKLYPEAFQDLRVIHYLRTQHFDRQKIFQSEGNFNAFLGLSLKGSEKLFQDHVRLLTDSRYPF